MNDAAIVQAWVEWLKTPHKFDHDPYSTVGMRMCKRCQCGAGARVHREWKRLDTERRLARVEQR